MKRLMKRLPFWLGFASIAVTFFRAGDYLANGVHMNWIGWFMAFVFSIAVFVSAYFTQVKLRVRHESYKRRRGLERFWIYVRNFWRKDYGRWIAFASLAFFTVVDLLFNEAEIIRTVANKEFVSSDASFLGYTGTQLEVINHFFALLVGAVPTFGALILGVLQGRADKMPVLERVGWFSQFLRAIWETLLRGIQANLADAFKVPHIILEKQEHRPQLLEKVEEGREIPVLAKKVRWEDLKVPDKEEISQMTVAQVLGKFPGISSKTVRNWKKRIEAGE